MILALATLAAYLQACAPSVAPDTMRAIVNVESSGYIYAINDNTAHERYCIPGTAVFPCDGRQAAAIAGRAVALGHSVDVGIAQVNSENFRTYGISATQMLDPCENLRVGSKILASEYRQARQRFSDERTSLWHAIMAYNSGSLYAGNGYVRSVLAAAIPMDTVPLVPSLEIFKQLEFSRVRTEVARTDAKRNRLRTRPDSRSAPLQVSGLGADSRYKIAESLLPAL